MLDTIVLYLAGKHAVGECEVIEYHALAGFRFDASGSFFPVRRYGLYEGNPSDVHTKEMKHPVSCRRVNPGSEIATQNYCGGEGIKRLLVSAVWRVRSSWLSSLRLYR